jgi:dihydrofolate reductase
MPNFVYIATSLDGFIADKNNEIGWLTEYPNPGKSDFGYAEFSAGIDALIMGRKTYEMVRSFGVWPYEQPVFVLSNTIREVPEELADKVKIISGKLDSMVRQLNASGLNNLYIDGGLAIQGFLNEDLIDELILSRIPVLLGDGAPLFGELQEELMFEHVETEVFDNGIVKSRYVRKREDQEP